jgi:putative endonuclease
MTLLRSAPPGIKSWVVYILQNADGLLYTGITNDLPRRVGRHNRGQGARYTKGRGPWSVAYTEPAEGHGAALRRERAIKKLSRAQKRRMITSPGGATP